MRNSFDIVAAAGKYWRDPVFGLNFLKAGSFFAFAIIVNYYAVRYATTHAGPSVPDAVLDIIPMMDTWQIDYYLAMYLLYAAFLFAVFLPQHLLFLLQSLSLLIVTRSVFINLTHLGIPAGTTPTMSFFTQGGDLFFSGHVAMPFLAALVFWDIRPIRYFFLFAAAFMGGEVLLGHQHYAIDVFAAPFITYGVFVISQKVFSIYQLQEEKKQDKRFVYPA